MCTPRLPTFPLHYEGTLIIPPEPSLPVFVRQVHDLMSQCKSGHAGIGAAMLLCTEFDSGFRHVEKNRKTGKRNTRRASLEESVLYKPRRYP